MDALPVRYIVLRDRRVWDDGAMMIGLQTDADGAVTLARVPGRADGQPIVHAPPYDAGPSGIAIGADGDVYLSNARDRTVVRVMRSCADDRHKVSRRVESPCGLVIASGRLYVADRTASRVLVLHLRTLELLAVLEGMFDEPTALAADDEGRVYVLDRGLATVLRFDRHGGPDTAFSNAILAHAAGAGLSGIAVGARNLIYIANDRTGVATYGSDGQFLGALPRSGGPAKPGALVARGGRLYAADADSGAIYVHQDKQGWLGTLGDYRGPVSAMACDAAGHLYCKPGQGEEYDTLTADAAYVVSGLLMAGPFDAGEQSQWERLHADVNPSSGTSATLRFFTSPPSPALSSTPAAVPVDAVWSDQATLAPSTDTLVSRSPAAAADTARYLWLRVLLTTSDAHRSPQLKQVEAATIAPSYMDHLPAVYRREDEPRQLLARWLAMFRAELGDWGSALDDVPRRFNTDTASADDLVMLARWLALRLPQRQDADGWRSLIGRLSRLYERRGTLFGLQEFCDLYTVARPDIFEAFHGRHVWQLGHAASTLGFGTGLAPALPDGMIVPGFINPEAALAGLRGDYYSGINFDRLERTRTDHVVDFWDDDSLAPAGLATHFSIRWTGQLLPRYSERFTFHVTSDDGVRLRINGRLIMDDWREGARRERTAEIVLTAERWYTFALEYFDTAKPSAIRLEWSSSSQPREIVPRDRLYAVVDENVRLGTPPAGTLLVGQTVVGESGPSTADEFGASAFSDTAHLFTALVPAAAVSEPAARRLFEQIVDEERPAHTDVHLCYVGARMRVGFQARVGIDAIVADHPAAMSLAGSRLGVESYLGDDDKDEGHAILARVGKHARVGWDSIAGDVEPR